MEATGSDWRPGLAMLEAHGLAVLLVHARPVKKVPGRKTAVNEAPWLQPRHPYGFRRGSFQLAQAWSALRASRRPRERWLDSAAAHLQPMQKALRHLHLPRQHVVSARTGGTGMQSRRALVAGPPALAVRAAQREGRCKAAVETRREARTGNDRREHVVALRPALALSDSSQAQIAAGAQEIAAPLEALPEEGRAMDALPAARDKTRPAHEAPCQGREA